MRPLFAAVTALVIAMAVSCGGNGGDLVVGATTSVQDTGLLDELVSAFERESGYGVTPVVAGSGHILELASRGELDVTLTHSPIEEERYVASGYLIERRPVMEDTFLLVGPPSDPAGVADAATLEEAFRKIAATGSTFITRADRSGTNMRELAVWPETGIDPAGQSWYQESGIGQGESLVVASDKGAYTLVDSATFAVLRDRVSLVEHVEDGEVTNLYSVSLVNPARHSNVGEQAARAFADFLRSPEAREVIANFGRDKYGEPLFSPVAAQ